MGKIKDIFDNVKNKILGSKIISKLKENEFIGKIINKVFSREFISYVVFGLLTTIVNIAIFEIGMKLGIVYGIANIIAVIGAKLFAYVTNKLFVFQHKCANAKELVIEIIKFVFARGFTGLVDIFGMFLAVELLSADKTITKCVLQVIVIILNYILSKKVVFKDSAAERKSLKKAYKKAARKHFGLVRSLTALCLVGTMGFWFGTAVAAEVDNALGVFVAGEFWELKNEDDSAVYYESDFDSTEEMLEYGSDICRQVEAEGAVLLINKKNTLPLAVGNKVSCFSTSSVNLVYGGTGTGSVDVSKVGTLKSALEAEGFEVNDTLWDFYETGAASKYKRPKVGYIPVKSEVHEAPWSLYTDDVLNSVADYGDAAIVVLSRVGGEHYDLEYETYNYLALDENERNMLENVCKMRDEGKVKKIVVLINSTNALQMDFLNDFDIDACLWIGGVGESGTQAVAQILSGKVNPSGSLADTYCYDNFSAPAMWNFKSTVYEGYENGIIPSNAETYMIYQEGIYVGYKYYETRYEDFVMGKGNAGDYDYSSTVAFPFGYGLSYSKFKYSDLKVKYNAGTKQYKIDVTVTNTGKAAGKETVQVYLQSPYTAYDIENGVEKASVSLCGFEKTVLLEPGASQRVTIAVNRSDIASYDAYGAGTYILDAGNYYFTVATDAHNAVNNILAAKGYTPENTDNRMTSAGNKALTYKFTQKKLDTTSCAVSANGTQITNQLSDADPNLYSGSSSKVTWLSRNDWEGTFPREIVKLALTEILIDDLQANLYDPDDYEAVEMPTMGADNGLKLYDLIGKDYDAPEWELLLDQLSFDDMVTLITDAFHFHMAVESINAPGSRDENGPQGLNNSFIAEESYGTAFPTGDVVAATFNKKLVYAVGNVIGNNCIMSDVDCLYGPGANIHRTPYGGRNFEYYSEDGYLSGIMCAEAVRGIEEKGINTIIKHFALNDCEADRIGLGVWLNEQAAREIYLKAFQAAFEQSDANGVMAAYTRWGAVWSGAYDELMTNILREEWGNNGWSISDNVRTTMITFADGILAGTTTFDAPLPLLLNPNQYKDDAVIVNAMREAGHRNLYALANSAAMNGIGADTEVEVVEYFMITLFRVIAGIFFMLAIPFAIVWYRRYEIFVGTEEYRQYKGLIKRKSSTGQIEYETTDKEDFDIEITNIDLRCKR